MLAAMLSSEHGLRALHRAIVDGRAGQPPRQIDADGSIAMTINNEPVGPMSNFWIRGAFRARPTTGGSPSAPAPTPLQSLNAAFAHFKNRIELVEDALSDVEAVPAPDGTPLVEDEGMDPVMVGELRAKLDHAMDRLSAYKAAWQRRHPRPSGPEPTEADVEAEEGEE